MLPVKGQTYTVMLQIRTFLWSATYGEKGKDKNEEGIEKKREKREIRMKEREKKEKGYIE